MKKAFIITCLFVIILMIYAVITANWHHVYYISGSLGLISIGAALFTYIDKLILGEKAKLFSTKEKMVKRTENSKKYLIASSVNLIATFIAFLLK